MTVLKSSARGHGRDATGLNRRRLLQAGVALGVGLTLSPRLFAAARSEGRRSLALANVHTGETLETIYWRNGFYRPEALEHINWLLRDFRTGEAIGIHRGLLDTLHQLALSQRGNGQRGFQVVSGYRSPQTNAMLREHNSRVAKNSFHMVGRAVDVRIEGCELSELRQAALELRAGGVGSYPNSNFLHIDTGPVRSW